MPNTVPNQKTVQIHRHRPCNGFLGINHSSWKPAARDLGAQAFMLYIYLASNANGYELALSPTAVRNAIGMPESTCRDQIRKLIAKGYLLLRTGNTYDFYEVPKIIQPDGSIRSARTAAAGTTDSKPTKAAAEPTDSVEKIAGELIEINKKILGSPTNNESINRPERMEPKCSPIAIEIPEVFTF